MCDLVQNYFHHDQKQPRQEVEDGYILKKNCKKNLTIISIIFIVHNEAFTR